MKNTRILIELKKLTPLSMENDYVFVLRIATTMSSLTNMMTSHSNTQINSHLSSLKSTPGYIYCKSKSTMHDTLRKLVK